MKGIKCEAFLEFVTDTHLWNLTRPFAKAVDQHLCFDPMILHLPWPVEAIPAVESKFSCGWLPDELAGIVQGVEYNLSPGKIKIEISIAGESGIEWRDVNDQFLIYLAKLGMVFLTGPPIAKVLRDAGLFPKTKIARKRSKNKK